MAEKRMVSLKITDTDKFLDMPMSSRLLYYDLLTRADDDGFVGSPKKIMKMIGVSDDDYTLLSAKQFIIPFGSGVCVIKDWKIHNYIAKDRYNETQYLNEKSQLILNDNKSYELNNVYTMDTKCIQVVDEMETQIRLDKSRLDKSRLDKDNVLGAKAPTRKIEKEPPVLELILNDKSFYPITQTQINKWIDLYPAVDVLQELKKMIGWCEANISKRKTKRGILAFVNGWLSRQQDKGGKQTTPNSGIDVLAQMYEEELKNEQG